MLTFMFQSTRPVRGATHLQACRIPRAAFQSTRPVRGATQPPAITMIAQIVSIHAPRAGRDTEPREP